MVIPHTAELYSPWRVKAQGDIKIFSPQFYWGFVVIGFVIPAQAVGALASERSVGAAALEPQRKPP
jgi:hypothetical protein